MKRTTLLLGLTTLLLAAVAVAQTAPVVMKQPAAQGPTAAPPLDQQVASLKAELATTKSELAALKADVKIVAQVIAQHAAALDQTAGHHVALCLSRTASGGLAKSGSCGAL